MEGRRREWEKRKGEGGEEDLGKEGEKRQWEVLYAYQRWLVFCFQILPDTYEVTVCEITAHKRTRHTHTLTLHTTSLNAGSTHCVLTTSFLQVSSKVVKSQAQLGIHRTIARLIQCLIKYLYN